MKILTILLITVLKTKSIKCYPADDTWYPICRTIVPVDKSLFIKAVLQSPPAILITAPPRFGKTCNLKLLEYFFNLQANSDGVPETKVNYSLEPVTDTSNYQIFVDAKMKILEEKDIVASHFGKYPIITAEFWALRVFFDNAISKIRKTVKESCMQHSYIRNSSHLTINQKRKMDFLIDAFESDKVAEEIIAHALADLAKALFWHYGRKVIVLLDRFDWILTHSMFSRHITLLKFREIVSLYSKIVSNLTKLIGKCVERIVITGSSWYISDLALYSIRKLKAYKFLQNDEFVDFYGINESEFHHLMKTKKIDSRIAKNITNFCNGHIYKSKRIYNINTMITIFRFGNQVAGQGYSTTMISLLLCMKRTSWVHDKLLELMDGKTVKITQLPNLRDNTTMYALQKIRSFDFVIDDDLADIFFSFLWEMGYLTVVAPKNAYKIGRKPREIVVKVTNVELADFLHEYVFYKEDFPFNTSHEIYPEDGY